MSVEVFEESIELEIGLIEAELPALSGGAEHRASYPYPFLRPTGRSSRRTFRTIVIENGFLRVTLLPALGGRILGIHDRRTGKDVLALPDRLLPIARGPRGAEVPDGIQIRLSGQDRLNSLGVVDTWADEEMEGDRAGLWIGEIAQDGSSFNACVSMAADRAELTVEVRAFNRLMRPIAYCGGVAARLGEGKAVEVNDGVAWYDASRDIGLAIRSTRAPFDYRSYREGMLEVARFGALRELSPRQLDAWTVVLTPLSRLGGLSGVGADASGWVSDEVLRIQGVRRVLGCKVVILTRDGQTLEAPVDVYPERAIEMPLAELPSPAEALILMDGDRAELLRVNRNATLTELAAGGALEPWVADPSRVLGEAATAADLLRAGFDVDRRHIAHLLLASKNSRDGRYREAGRELEQALLFDAEDHLAWWSKAVMARLSGDDREEAPELLNAHFLAPLEPALRAESFLSQSAMMGKEPSPVLRPLAESPEQFVEVACLLLELGLYDQATRWLDEALRHVDLAMLRYLLAYSYLTASRMSVEAAEYVSAAGRQPIGPPFPWRPIEGRALRALQERFPDDAAVTSYKELYEGFAAQ